MTQNQSLSRESHSARERLGDGLLSIAGLVERLSRKIEGFGLGLTGYGGYKPEELVSLQGRLTRIKGFSIAEDHTVNVRLEEAHPGDEYAVFPGLWVDPVHYTHHVIPASELPHPLSRYEY